jgi:hypothetical protein
MSPIKYTRSFKRRFRNSRRYKTSRYSRSYRRYPTFSRAKLSPIYRRLKSIAPEFKHINSILTDQYFSIPKFSGSRRSNVNYSNFFEWNSSYPSEGIGDNQYIGNAFNVRQLSFKIRIRTLPLIDYS